MAAIASAAGSNNWNTNGAWVGGVQPTAADDVTITALTTVTIPTAVTAVARSVTVSATATLAFATTTSVLTIGDGTAGAGNVAFSNAGTITLTGIGTINFISTSATQQTIASGGQTLPNLTFNAASNGSWLFSDNITSSGQLTFTQGTLNTNGKTCSWTTYSSSNSNVRTLTMGASNITITTGGWSQDVTNLTITANTATITLSGAAVTFSGGAINYNGTSVVMTGSGQAALGSSSTLANFTRTGTAIKTDSLLIGNAGVTITGTLALAGNSTTNRLLINSNNTGTATSITLGASAICRTGGTQNVDFMDVTMSGGAANERNLSAITGNSGDCLGNTGITFTPAATQTHTTSAGGNWSDATKWTSRVPLPQDNVIVDSNTTSSITADMPRLGADITFTGFAGTWSTPSGGIGTYALFGSLLLGTGMLISGSGAVQFGGRSSHTITHNSVGWASNSLTILAGGGTYTLQDAMTAGTVGRLTLNSSFNSNGFSLTVNDVVTIAGTITGGASTWTLRATSGTPWSYSGGTISMASATIVLTNASTSTRTFAGGGNSYGTLTYTVASSPGILAITGANTFTTINVGSGRNLQLVSATTQTVTNWNVNGVNNGYVRLPGVAANYASAPDSAALSITGDITVLVRAALNNWTPASPATLINKYDAGTSQRSYTLAVLSAGTLEFRLSSTGVANSAGTSSVSTGFVDGTTNWILASWRASDGRTQFYTASGAIASPVASDFVQLGTDQTNAVGSIFDSTAALELGSSSVGTTGLAIGNFYRAKVYNGVFSTAAFGGTLQLDADLTTKAFGANSFTESSSNAATVTINGVLTQAGDGRVALTASTPASAATLSFLTRAVSGYLTVQDNTASTTTPAYAGANGILVSNTTNWLATVPVGIFANLTTSSKFWGM